MQKRTLISLVVVFVALLTYVLVVEVGQKEEREEQKVKEEQILPLDVEAMRRVRIDGAYGPVDMEFRGDPPDGEWFLTVPYEGPADPSTASSLARAVATLKENRKLETVGEDLSQYGLETPGLKITVEAEGIEQRILLFGSETGAGDGRYVQIEGETGIHIIPSFQYRPLDKTVDDLRDRRVAYFDRDAATKIALHRGDEDVVIQRIDNVWRMSGTPYRANRQEVDNLLAELTTTRVSRFLDADDPELGLADGERWIEVHLDGASNIRILIGVARGDVMAVQTVGAEDAGEMGTALLRKLDQTAESWRTTEVADINPWKVGNLTFQFGGRSFVLNNDEDDRWFLTEGDQKPTKLDEERALEILGQIDGLDATSLLSPGEDPGPQVGHFELTTEGEPLVQFTLHRSGERWAAQVHEDPAAMQIPETFGLFLEEFLANPAGNEL